MNPCKNESTAPRRLRVAAYCRVSTLMDAQVSSFETQCEVWRRTIEQRADYELAGVYGDHGLSGRTMDGRPGMQRLLRDCESGKIDLILSKSIARFSRNLGECVSTVRRLKQLGVAVHFDQENIDTFDPRSELLFHLLATVAAEESNSLSRNLALAHDMRARRGEPQWRPHYGYRKSPSGGWLPEPRQARLVRTAFFMACGGCRIAEIRAALLGMEAQTPTSRRWRPGDVSVLLRDVFFRGDWLTHATLRRADGPGRVRNRGQRDRYYLEGHHPPLVPPEIFDHVQRLLAASALWLRRSRYTPADRALLREGRALLRHFGISPVSFLPGEEAEHE